jgi:hypothetical protein
MSGLFSLRLNQPLKYTVLIVLVLTVTHSLVLLLSQSYRQHLLKKDR